MDSACQSCKNIFFSVWIVSFRDKQAAFFKDDTHLINEAQSFFFFFFLSQSLIQN